MKTIRIAGAQGFYGDSPLGAIQIAMQGEADYLMHDALAELTLSILQRIENQGPDHGLCTRHRSACQNLVSDCFFKGH